MLLLLIASSPLLLPMHRMASELEGSGGGPPGEDVVELKEVEEKEKVEKGCFGAKGSFDVPQMLDWLFLEGVRRAAKQTEAVFSSPMYDWPSWVQLHRERASHRRVVHRPLVARGGAPR